MGNIFKKRLGKLFKSADFGALVLYNGGIGSPDANFYYFTGCSVDNSLAVLTADSQTLYCPKMNLAQAKAQSWMDCREAGKDVLEQVRRIVRRSKIGADFGSIPASRYLRWRKRLGKLQDAGGKMLEIRAVKEEREIESIAKAVRIAKKILAKMENGLKDSKTEAEIAKSLITASFEMGCSPAFEPIVAAGGNSRFPHHIPTNRKIGNGIVLIDFGVKYEGYCSDLTRCYFLGECKKEKSAYEKAKGIFAEIAREMPGHGTGADIAKASDKLNAKSKLPPLPHSIGHGIGLEVHESPSLRKKSKDKLQPGNVLAIEPSAYFPSFGVRFEEDILILPGRKASVL